MSATKQKVFAVSLRGLDALSKKIIDFPNTSHFSGDFYRFDESEGAYV